MDVEGLNHLGCGEDVAVGAQRPAQQGQVVEESLGDHAAVAVDEEVRLRIALGQLPVALPHDVGQVPELGHDLGPADLHEGLIEHHLPRGGGQQVLAAKDMGDAHGCVIDGVDQRVEGLPARAHDDVVRYATRLEGDGSADQVGEGDVLIRYPHPQDGEASLGAEGVPLLLGQVAVEAVVAELGVLAALAMTGLDLPGSGVGLVQVARLQQLGGHLPVQVHPLGLAVGLVRSAPAHALVPVQAEPGQGVEDGLEGLLGIPGGVGVLDAEDEGATGMTGVGPVEQAGAHHAHVRDARGRGAEADADRAGAVRRRGGRHVRVRRARGVLSHSGASLAPPLPSPRRGPRCHGPDCLHSAMLP